MNIQILNNGIIKVGKNQVYQDGVLFVVEKYEYTENGVDMFSVYDGYYNFIQAINIAHELNEEED